ncbi:MAG: acyltransferase [Alphaproteobacteria bacterium]|nr:acyltransferase [Alphaproteobacteria bacterium]
MHTKQTNANSGTQNTQWVSVLTVLSCVAVVYLHVNGIYWTHPSGMLWHTSSFIECLFYFAVPCFFMLSGYTLLDYRQRYSTKLFLKKRFVRVFIPLLVWSAFYYTAYNDMHFDNGFWSSFLHCRIEDLFYFLYQIQFCYLGMIYFSLIPNKMRHLKWIIVCCFVFFSVLPFLHKAEILHMPWLKLFTDWQPLLFCFLGYFLGNTNLSSKQRAFIYVLGFIGFLFHYFGTTFVSFLPGKVDQLYKGYYTFPAVFYSSAIFVWCKNFNWDFIFKYKVSKALFNKVLSCTLSIYLAHIMIVYHTLPVVYSYFGINDYPIKCLAYRIVAPLVIIFIICSVIIFLARFLPVRLHCLLGYKKE